jgi:NADH-quinone oxidoreductase subunit N
MNLVLLGPELAVVILGIAVLMADLFVPAARRRMIGGVAAAIVFVLFIDVAVGSGRAGPEYAFGGTFVLDGLASFFKALFLLAASIVLLLAVEWSARFESHLMEYFALTLFALAGMLLAASANDFSVMYVALELVTVTFYVLTSYQRARVASLEAGVKYLILGALSSAIMVYGIALCYGAAGSLSFVEVARQSAALADNRLFQLGLLLVLGGLSFKTALFPFQIWAPDVYEGSPAPTTAFLAIGSKAAGVVLLVRLLGGVVPDLAFKWETLLMAMAAISILYGSLCAIPQRSFKRLLGYSSIANAGFVMIGIAAASRTGSAAVLYYLAAYLFTVLAAFVVIGVVIQSLDTDEIAELAGLHRRSPLLAAGLSMSMISLAGVPPLAGFLAKFFVLKALVDHAPLMRGWYWIAGIAIIGVGISFWYYFGVVRVVYWSEARDPSPLRVSPLMRLSLGACIAGMLYLGVFPGPVWEAARAAVVGLWMQAA